MCRKASSGGFTRRLNRQRTSSGRGGSVAQLINTACILCVFFGWVCPKHKTQLLRFCNNWFPFSLQGITKSLIDAQFGNESLNGSHNKEISHALGYCIGFVIGTTCSAKIQCSHKLFELNFHSFFCFQEAASLACSAATL